MKVIVATYRLKRASVLLSACILYAGVLFSQDWAKPVIKNQQRVDLRDLGYPSVNEIPVNSSAITSLLTAGSGKVYGGTSGEESYFFMFDPVINKVRHLGKLEGHTGIHHSLAEDREGNIYIGTGKSIFEEIILSEYGEGDENIDGTLWKDIKKNFRSYPGGHLFRYKPAMSDDKVKLPGMNCEAEDLGLPVANNSIYALTTNSSGDEIYGITYPDGHFFVYNIAQNKFADIGLIDSAIVYHGPERYWRTLARALICDDSGRVFMSGNNGRMLFYDPGTEKLVPTSLEIPGDYYYIQFFKDYTAIECFAKDSAGLIYGGTTDGYLFSFDPVRMEINNLGKPRGSRRLRCMTTGHDGKVYMMAGEISSTRPCQFYAYDPLKCRFENLGMLIADRSPYYYWRGQQFDSMTTGIDGTIYLGESERNSHLFIYLP